MTPVWAPNGEVMFHVRVVCDVCAGLCALDQPPVAVLVASGVSAVDRLVAPLVSRLMSLWRRVCCCCGFIVLASSVC